MHVSRREFEELVAAALDEVPEPFASALHEVAVVVEERAPDDDPDLYGLYYGVPLTQPDGIPGSMPPWIAIYMHPLADDCETREELVEEVRITVLHELAHHLGFDEDRLEELGYG